MQMILQLSVLSQVDAICDASGRGLLNSGNISAKPTIPARFIFCKQKTAYRIHLRNAGTGGVHIQVLKTKKMCEA